MQPMTLDLIKLIFSRVARYHANMPIDLKLDAGQALIVFDTGMGSQIPLKAK
jgi:hypothetical protein